MTRRNFVKALAGVYALASGSIGLFFHRRSKPSAFPLLRHDMDVEWASHTEQTSVHIANTLDIVPRSK